MRPYLACAPAVAMVLTVFACTETTVQVVKLDPEVAEGGTVTEDGAVVGPDGEVIDPPDTSIPPKPSLVNVKSESLTGFTDQRGAHTIAVPKNYAATKQYPLVLVIHGDGGDGAGMRAYHPLDDATGSDAIVVYPSGKVNTWDLSTPFDQNTDQKYVEALIAAMKSQYSIDAARVFAVGWSSGGFLVSQLTCRKALFKGIVIHAGGAPFENPGAKDADGYEVCPGLPKVPALVTHGTNDGAVLVSSGAFAAKHWAHYAGCDPETRVATTPAPCKKHAACPADKPVTYCEIPGQNHGIWNDAIPTEWAFLKAL
jgi:polyhydroxybutyrate depolymerase